MDLKRLLNLKIINFEQIDHILSARKQSFQERTDFPDVDFFRRIVSTEIPIINYYSGDIEVIKKLIPFSNKKNIVLFPSDIIEVRGRHGRLTQYTSNVFFTHIIDSLAHNDGFIVPETNEALNLYNISSIRIVKENSKEIEEFIKDLEKIQIEKEVFYIENQLVSIVNDLIGSFTDSHYKNFSHLLSNLHIKQLNDDEIKKIKTLLDRYVSKGDVFSLVEVIRRISSYS